VIRDIGTLDISEDIVKPFHDSDARRVHLDKNALEASRWYTVKFYVQG